jgi:hypothetical protein
MSSHAELSLYSQLHDTDAVARLAAEKIPLDVLATDTLRPMVAWAIEHYFTSGQRQAPSREMQVEVWGTALADADVTLLDEGSEIDHIAVVLENLRGQYVYAETSRFLRAVAEDIAGAEPPKRLDVLSAYSVELSELVLALRSHAGSTTVAQGATDALRSFEDRVGEQQVMNGMSMFYDEVDAHTYGIRPGELAILAAPTKAGKSYMTVVIALHNYLHGRKGALFTLENSIEMTMDRMICMSLGVSSRRWARGECTPSELARVHALIDRTKGNDVGELTILTPDRGFRTPQAIIREAQILGADDLYIDQLTFVDHHNPGRKALWEQTKDKLHDIKAMISTGPKPMATLMAHQINREGIKAAMKSSRLDMSMLAEGSEVERTADWVFGLLVTESDRQTQEASLQILASRREDLKAWRLVWQIEAGSTKVIHEITSGTLAEE